MLSRFAAFALLGLLAAGLSGCASDEIYTQLPREPGRSVALDTNQKPQQCVPYARDHSDVKLYGDAYTWWDQAAGKFARESQPVQGAVMVLTGYAGPERGHVAVVSKIISAREIRVDHANWLDDGSIYLNDPVEDVSADNDWSRVRVYNIKAGGWGGNVYPVQGFIRSASDSVSGSVSVPDDGRPTPKPGQPLQARAAPKPAPRTAPKPAPETTPDDSDPLPNPDMVVSANYTHNQQ